MPERDCRLIDSFVHLTYDVPMARVLLGSGSPDGV